MGLQDLGQADSKRILYFVITLFNGLPLRYTLGREVLEQKSNIWNWRGWVRLIRMNSAALVMNAKMKFSRLQHADYHFTGRRLQIGTLHNITSLIGEQPVQQFLCCVFRLAHT